MKTLEDIKKEYKDVFLIKDEHDIIIDIILAITISAKMYGDPIWLLIVGPSSGGKTELINTITKVPFVHNVSTMTENTLLSGMKPKNGQETSLLHKIGKRGMITMKDYTSILAMREDKKEQIIGQLREVYDGEFTKRTGTGQDITWSGKLTFIGGVTDAIFFDETGLGFGFRNIMFVLPDLSFEDRMDILKRVQKNVVDIDKKRDSLQDLFKDYIAHKVEHPENFPTADDIPQQIKDNMMSISNFVTIARTPVKRDFQSRVKGQPMKEAPARMFTMMLNLSQNIMFLNDKKELTHEQEFGLYKTLFDSIPLPIFNVIKQVTQYSRVTTKGLAHKLNMPTETVRKWLEDLNVLDIVHRVSEGGFDKWSMVDKYKKLMISFNKIEEIKDELDWDDDDTGYGHAMNEPRTLDQLRFRSKVTDDPGLASEIKENMKKEEARVQRVFDSFPTKIDEKPDNSVEW